MPTPHAHVATTSRGYAVALARAFAGAALFSLPLLMTKSKRDPIPPLEWAAAAFGLLVVIALLAIIGRGAVHMNGDDAPVLVASIERIVAAPAGHIVEIAVDNRGPVTAASVQVEGIVGQGAAAETSTASIDDVPGHSRATGGLMFTRDPTADGLRLRVTGYELP